MSNARHAPTPFDAGWVQATRFKLPKIGMALAFGPTFAMDFSRAQKEAQAQGLQLEIFGWPDGTTISWKWPADGALDEADLFLAYCAFQQRMAEDQDGGRHDA